MSFFPKPTRDIPPPLRNKPWIGQMGLGLAVASTLGMVLNQVMAAIQKAPPINLLFFVFAFMYLNGAFLAVSTFGYRRGGKLYAILMACRVATVGAVIFALGSVMR